MKENELNNIMSYIEYLVTYRRIKYNLWLLGLKQKVLIGLPTKWGAVMWNQPKTPTNTFCEGPIS